MVVGEYVAFGASELPIGREATGRLFGWQLDLGNRARRKMPGGPDGGLWSAHLQSVLLPQGEFLRLYDRQGHLRLTQTDAQARRAEIEARRAEMEAGRAEIEARRAQVMAEKLRSLGIDPDQL